MKNQTAIISVATLLLAGTLEFGAAQQDAAKALRDLRVKIDTQLAAQPVSPYEYGMFIEHIGALIYRSLWSEMLDDRKFFFAIKPEESRRLHPCRAPSAICNCESGSRSLRPKSS